MNNLFCVVSAVAVDYGVFNYQTRYNQLLETIASIHRYQPNAKIVLVEVSDKPVPYNDLSILQQFVHHVIDCVNHPVIRTLTPTLAHKEQDTNLFARKTIGELIAMIEFLKWCKTCKTPFKRVYKLSGRLQLNEKFVEHNYTNSIAVMKRCWHRNAAYLTQLWSFDYKLLDSISKLFDQLWEYEMDEFKNKEILHVYEAIFCKFVNHFCIPVYEIQGILGVQGFHGQDGAEVNL